MNAEIIKGTRWSTSLRKAFARLIPAGAAREQTEGSSEPQADFWSDFSRKSRESHSESDPLADKGGPHLKVLVPFDFTASSCVALDCALRMAQGRKATIILLHAIHLNLSPYGPANPGLIKQDMRRTANARISRLAAAARQNNILVDYAVQDGKPCEVIERFIQEHDVDLVIIGQCHHRGFGWPGRRALAEKVIRQAQCPVLVLRSND